jgi:hypothetical protein
MEATGANYARNLMMQDDRKAHVMRVQSDNANIAYNFAELLRGLCGANPARFGLFTAI